MSSNNFKTHQFGDTTLTKIFVGGLAWETPKESLRDYFDKFGDILEAVIISDKISGRSKGYGFVTFRDAEAAKNACEDSTPLIDGRRANCNLASIGGRRPRSGSSTAAPLLPSPKQYISRVGHGSTISSSPGYHVRWHYPFAPPYHHHPHAVPFYGYSSPYVSSNAGYNQKHGYNYPSGSYFNGGHLWHQAYPGYGMVGANTMMPIYPFYRFNHGQMLPVPSMDAVPITTVPTLVTKPTNPGLE